MTRGLSLIDSQTHAREELRRRSTLIGPEGRRRGATRPDGIALHQLRTSVTSDPEQVNVALRIAAPARSEVSDVLGAVESAARGRRPACSWQR